MYIYIYRLIPTGVMGVLVPPYHQPKICSFLHPHLEIFPLSRLSTHQILSSPPKKKFNFILFGHAGLVNFDFN